MPSGVGSIIRVPCNWEPGVFRASIDASFRSSRASEFFSSPLAFVSFPASASSSNLVTSSGLPFAGESSSDAVVAFASQALFWEKQPTRNCSRTLLWRATLPRLFFRIARRRRCTAGLNARMTRKRTLLRCALFSSSGCFENRVWQPWPLPPRAWLQMSLSAARNTTKGQIFISVFRFATLFTPQLTVRWKEPRGPWKRRLPSPDHAGPASACSQLGVRESSKTEWVAALQAAC